MTAPPQYSPDGQWWWDGTQWVPAPQAAAPPPWAGQPAAAAPPWASTDQPQPTWHGPQQPYPPYGAPVPAKPSDNKAIVSFVLSLVWVGGLASIAAVILGHLSRSEARKQGRAPNGLALAGLILGYLGIAATALMVGLVIAFGGEIVDNTEAVAELQSASDAQGRFHDSTGRYATSLEELRGYGYDDLDGTSDVTVVRATADDYCLQIHSFGTTWSAKASRPEVSTGSC